MKITKGKVQLVAGRTGEDKAIVPEVLRAMSNDALAACAAIELAQFYERHPVDFAHELRCRYSSAEAMRRAGACFMEAS